MTRNQAFSISPLASSGEEELAYAEFLAVRAELASLRSLPERVTEFRPDRQQREIAELYNAFEHYTALADVVFEELQRRLNSPSGKDEQPAEKGTQPGKLLAFPQRA